MKNFNLGGLHEKVFDLSSYLKDGEGFAGLLQSYNNFAGNLAVDKNSMVITIDDLGSASEDVSGSITWKKGAQFEEVSGDTFDLGNATEEEWQDLLHEIFAAMLGGF